jgi:hypothetical protein
MHMVRHETVRPDRHVKLPTPFGHQINRDLVILTTKEGRLPAIARLDDVMMDSRSDYSCDLTHEGTLENHTRLSRIRYGVPGIPRKENFLAGVPASLYTIHSARIVNACSQCRQTTMHSNTNMSSLTPAFIPEAISPDSFASMTVPTYGTVV